MTCVLQYSWSSVFISTSKGDDLKLNLLLRQLAKILNNEILIRYFGALALLTMYIFAITYAMKEWIQISMKYTR